VRTLLPIIVITLLLLGGSYTSHRFIQTTTQMIGDQLDTVEGSLAQQKWEAAKNELTTAEQSWEKSDIWWTVLLDHQEIEAIDLSLKRLEKNIEAQDFSHSIGEVSTLKLRFKSIYESVKLTVKNIF